MGVASASEAQQNEEMALQVEGMEADVKLAAQANNSRQDYRLVFRTEAQNSEFTFSEEAPEFFSQLVLEAPLYESEDRPPVDIVAVLDVSGSMRGEKISLVRKSMRRLIRSLGSKDRVAFITFDTTVRVVMNFCELNEKNKDQAFKIIGALKSGSQTNLSGGVEEGIRQLLNNRVNEVAAVLLFTDGAANAGITSTEGIVQSVLQLVNPPSQIMNPEEIEKWTVAQVGTWLEQNNLGMYTHVFTQNQIDGNILINDLTEDLLSNNLNVSNLHIPKMLRGILKLKGVDESSQVEGQPTTTKKKAENSSRRDFRLHTFGFGASHNEDLLQKLAESFDGMYFFMENSEMIKEGFANCMGGILTTVAQNIEVEIQFNPEVTGARVYKKNVTESNGIYKIQFADLQSEENRDVLVSCTLPAKEEAESEFLLFEATYSYQNAIANMQNQGAVQCMINRSGRVEGFSEKVDETKNREVANLALQDAISFGDKNNVEGARGVLEKAIKRIERSKTANDPKCQGLLGDLRTAKNELRDKTTYKSSGRKYMRQNVSSYAQQRSCNTRSERYQYQTNFTSRRKTEMTRSWQTRDALDSDSDEDDNTYRRQMRNTTAPSQRKPRRRKTKNRSSNRRRSQQQPQPQVVAPNHLTIDFSRSAPAPPPSQLSNVIQLPTTQQKNQSFNSSNQQTLIDAIQQASVDDKNRSKSDNDVKDTQNQSKSDSDAKDTQI